MAGYYSYDDRPRGQASRPRPWSPPVPNDREPYSRDFDPYPTHNPQDWGHRSVQRAPFPEGADNYYDPPERHRGQYRRREPSSDHNYGYDYAYNVDSRDRQARREASEVSVEALDLADYAMALRRGEPEYDPYGYPPQEFNRPRPFSREYAMVPTPPPTNPTISSGRRRFVDFAPSSNNTANRSFSPPSAYLQRTLAPSYLVPPPGAAPPIDRPFSAQSRDTTQPPPSLISAGATSHSSQSHANSIYPPPPSASMRPFANRRPQSLPVDFLPPRWPEIGSSASGLRQTRGAEPPVPVADRADSAIFDVNDFPPWSRGWYDQNATRMELKDPNVPTYTTESGFYGQNAHAGTQPDYLPWNGAAADEAVPGSVPDDVKAERLRLLEREFGAVGTPGAGNGSTEVYGDIGTVDERGNLITAGPKKRATARWLQGLFALGTAGSGIYGALFIKSKKSAPAAGKPPAFVLYILSCITFLLVFYFHALRPCLGRRKSKKAGPNAQGPAGMMVLPVTTPAAKGKKKKGKHKKGGPGEPGSIQVNLIVDPNAFGDNYGTGRGDRMPGRFDSDMEDESVAGTGPSSSRSRGGGRGDKPARRSYFQTMAMEDQWKAARSELKKVTTLDFLITIAWIGAFVLIMLGERCPSGEFDGWCDAYNWATAGASILAVAFAVSIFFDFKDLNASKLSPRARLRT